MKFILSLCVTAIAFSAHAKDWPQGSGPEGNLQIAKDAPTQWSVAHDENIA